jgi:alpha-mannosidase
MKSLHTRGGVAKKGAKTSSVSAKDATRFSVISHTHWDREWHMSFERFRLRLVNLVDNLLEILAKEPSFIFHLDAQSICVEDYLAVRPAREKLMRKYIREGRILVGPWYVQNDFYLTSGEATVRNLLIGKKMAEDYGRCDTVGYAPDQFGNIGQLPQLLRGFGIDNFVFGRGWAKPARPGTDRSRKPQPTEFTWQGPDGSELLAVHMAFWYNNAQRFPANLEHSQSLVEANERGFKKIAATPFQLLMNGVDHLEAQEDLLPILDGLNKRLDGGRRIEQDTLASYLARVRAWLKKNNKKLKTHRGELREGWDVMTHLAATASSRVYLKTQNVQAQVLFENKLEPLFSIIAMLGAGKLYPHDYLTYLWKTLIQNHPHDSICGCSVDEVHRNMEDRSLRIFETGDELLRQGLDFLSAHADRSRFEPNDYIITIVNTLADKRAACVDVDLSFKRDEKVKSFSLTNIDGEPLEFTVLEKDQDIYCSISPVNLPGNIDVDRYRVRIFLPVLPAFGVSYLRVHPQQTSSPDMHLATTIKHRGNCIENEALQLSIKPNGTADLRCKETGKLYKNIFTLEETGDIGNAYQFVLPKGEKTYSTRDMKVVSMSQRLSSLSQELEVDYAAMLPAEYDFKRRARSSRLVKNIITLRFTLSRKSPFVEISATIQNRSKDHRLRFVLNSGFKTDRIQAAAPFEIVERKNSTYLKEWNAGDCPNSGFVTITDKKTGSNVHGLTLLNEGLSEYKHLDGNKGRVALTLVRATGAINGDLTNQPAHWLCPENQCLRNLDMRLAIYPHQGDALAARCSSVLQEFLVSPLTHYDAYDMTKFTGGRAPVQSSGVAHRFFREPSYPGLKLSRTTGLLTVHGKHLVLSACKRSEDGKRQLLRLYNASGKKTTLRLERPGGFSSAELLNLEEKPVRKIKLKGQKTEIINVGPAAIVTVGFT